MFCIQFITVSGLDPDAFIAVVSTDPEIFAGVSSELSKLASSDTLKECGTSIHDPKQ